MVAAAALTPARGQQVCDTGVYALSSPSARFADSGDGTVTDKQSRLTWMRCAAGQEWSGGRCVGEARTFDWNSAQAAAAEINAKGRYFFDDWRLPNIRELATIAERECATPRINLQVFPDTPAEWFWSATTRHRPTGDAALALSFGSEGVRVEDQDQHIHVRLVRNSE